MITLEEDNEYSVIIADLIETLSATNKFELKIWIRGTEIPYIYYDDCNFHFMQEGVRIMVDNRIDWMFYDEIATVRCIYES